MSAMAELPMVTENALSDGWVLNHWKTQLTTIINSDRPGLHPLLSAKSCVIHLSVAVHSRIDLCWVLFFCNKKKKSHQFEYWTETLKNKTKTEKYSRRGLWEKRGEEQDKGMKDAQRETEMEERCRWRQKVEEEKRGVKLAISDAACGAHSYMRSTRLTIRAPQQLKCSSSFYRIIIMNQR